VTFVEIPPATIERYLGSGEWSDRAGGYAVQGMGSAFVERVEGDLSNVIGLPIPLVSRMIDGLQDGLQSVQK
jgi:septum formation protein